jgi:hypothetical protein
MTIATRGFQGEISWVEETAYGDGVDTADTLLLIANQVQSVRVSHTKGSLGETRNIGSYDVADFVWGTLLYGVTVEYLVDRNYSSTNMLMAKSIDRTSGDISSVAMQIGIGKDSASTDRAWLNLKGCKARNVTVNTDRDAPVVASIDFSVKDIATSTDSIATCSDTIATSPCKFTGGSFKRGGSAAWGYIVGGVSVTIDNGLSENKDIGNTTLHSADAGPRAVTGSVNVCVTDGGRTYLAESTTMTDTAVEFDFGTGTTASLRMTSAVVGSIEIPLDSDSPIVMTSLPLTGTSITLEAV